MSRRKEVLALVQDVIIAVIVVAVVLASLWAYGGRWPPMVVVESESMQHSDDSSYIGVIDTGDLTLVRTLEKVDGVVTWVEGKETGHRTYGEFGDVIVYHKNGMDQTTPIIHRAIVRVEWNESGPSLDVPSLGRYGVRDSFTIEGVNSYHSGQRQRIDLHIDARKIVENLVGNPHGGIITKGDHNEQVDQNSLYDQGTGLVQPVQDGWIVGVARGEIPWFGLIKLWIKGQTKQHPAPANSAYNLVISIALLLVGPLLAESIIVEYRKKRRKEEKRGPRRRRGAADEEEGVGGESLPRVIWERIKGAFSGLRRR